MSSTVTILNDGVPIESLIFGTEEAASVDQESVVVSEDQTQARPQMAVATTGLRFVIGQLEFSFTALPPDLVLVLKMFDAAKTGNLEELRAAVEAGKNAEVTLPYVSPSLPVDDKVFWGGMRRVSVVSVVTTQGVDINTDYQAPSYDDAHLLVPGFTRRRSLACRTRMAMATSPDGPMDATRPSSGEARLLLHVAILMNHLEMTKYLLNQGADVSPRTDTPTHTHTHTPTHTPTYAHIRMHHTCTELTTAALTVVRA